MTDDPKTVAPKMVGKTQDDQADNAARGKSAAKEPDPSTRAAELEAELAAVRREAAGGATVRVRVDPDSPHSGMVHNGLYIGEEWTEVPAHVVPDMMEGAANAGVTLTQEETES